MLIWRLVHDKRGRKILSSEEEVIQFLGIPFYEQQDQLFTMKRSFMQSIEDLLKSEVNYVLAKKSEKANGNGRTPRMSSVHQSMRSDVPDFGRPSSGRLGEIGMDFNGNSPDQKGPNSLTNSVVP